MTDHRTPPVVAAMDNDLVITFTRTDATAVNITGDMGTVRVSVTGAYNVPINLPNPAEVAGRLFSIEVTGASSGVATLNTGATGAVPEFGVVDGQELGTTDDVDAVLLYSDGRAWWRIGSSGLA